MKVTVNKQYTVILEKTDKQLLEELINNSWGGFGSIDSDAVTDLVSWCEKLSALMEDAQ